MQATDDVLVSLVLADFSNLRIGRICVLLARGLVSLKVTKPGSVCPCPVSLPRFLLSVFCVIC